MLSKPLIVTENVGAKYMVGDENGIVVPTGEVGALRDAFMRIMNLGSDELIAMGNASRVRYDKLASMGTHSHQLEALFSRRIAAGPLSSVPVKKSFIELSSSVVSTLPRELIVSLTSFPPRMQTISSSIRSLKNQTKKPDRILLWLSADQFPEREKQLPTELLDFVDHQFEIRWVADDLAPHKKYFYVMQEFPDALVITVDDDVEYDRRLVSTLYSGHLDHPYAVIAGRSNLIRFRRDGTLRAYDNWGYEHQFLREVETFALLPTGIGGVLYPPGSIPTSAFNVGTIKSTCLHADDLWLKIMATANGYPVWMPDTKFNYHNLAGSQDAALWRGNSFQNKNDLALKSILEFLGKRYGIAETILRRIWGVRSDGTFIGPGDEIDRSSLLIEVD
ncbi:MAG: hypothetical protein MnENMB40S_14140 [Rhizobiaceae bacterium MnEN-MB40S]|nr:MAG: hypothetical protein MnENMB40S_14140 [Rhizobiaceae bacterium MnEN-MB40S]